MSDSWVSVSVCQLFVVCVVLMITFISDFCFCTSAVRQRFPRLLKLVSHRVWNCSQLNLLHFLRNYIITLLQLEPRCQLKFMYVTTSVPTSGFHHFSLLPVRMVKTSPHLLDLMWKHPPPFLHARWLIYICVLNTIFETLLSPLTWFYVTIQGSHFGSEEIKVLILHFLQQWVFFIN